MRDEIQNFCDAQLSMTMFNRLIGYAAAQRVKPILACLHCAVLELGI
jgi:hypothetical protein